jgi:hypothetical protein
MKIKFTLLLFLFGALTMTFAQEQSQGPTYIGTADELIYVPSLSSRMDQLTPSTVKPPKEAQDGRSYRVKREIVPGKGRQPDVLSQNPHRLSQKIQGRAPDLVWTAATSNSQPTDPSIAVGPNHVFAVFNTGFAIYDKDGNTLVGQTAPNPAIFPSSGCCDLTVSYDPVATSASNSEPGRWVVSFLGGGAQVAVSDGPDPVTSGWNVYRINTINDYQKLSVWSDGYYVSDQKTGNRMYAMERQAMLDGAPASEVSIQGFTLPNFRNQGFASVQALNISDDQYPGPGNATVVFFQDDAYPGQSEDSIKFWDLDVDFDTPGNSTISAPQEIVVTPFTSIFDGTSFNNLTQPGGSDIDALQGIIMNQAQYKKFPSYESAIFNFVIDIDPTGGEQAAIRWYEFRRDTPTDPWVMVQEGTFADPDGRHFWHGSMIMDSQGNIGMGFSALGNTSTGNGLENEFVSSYYTGRLSSDPSGVMTIEPQLIAQGGNNIPGIRYGDYSKIDIDPSDYKRMYFTNEVMFPGRSNVVGRFQIAPNFDLDAGVVDIVTPVDGDLSAPQDVTVTVRNFGINEISDVPVSYSVDGGAVVNAVVPGPIGSGLTVDYTFDTQADLSVVGQTYTIEASTALEGDEDNGNDMFSKEVTHLEVNDTGVTSISSPISGSGLTSTEDVTVEISNFGSATQTSIPVFYSVNGGTPVQETYTGSIATGETDTYTFTTQADLSELGTYDILAGTELVGDADESNDDTSISVSNTSCIPEGNCAGFNDGVTEIQLADQNISTNCNETGYSDDTDIVFTFPLAENPFTGVLQMGWVDSEFALWIDFNDDGVFDADELVANELVATANSDFEFTIDFNDFPNATQGVHLMRLRGEDESGAGDVTNPCDDLQFGRTNDYTADITSLGTADNAFADGSELIIVDEGNDQFKLVLNTASVTNTLILSVFDTTGKTLLQYPLNNESGNGYEYNLDMSYVASGVYIVQLRDENYSSAKRLIVR